MKTSELTGALLDWWVAKAEGANVVDCNRFVRHLGMPLSPVLDDGGGRDGPHYYRPSTNWAQGGPIIERERISPIFEQFGIGNWIAAYVRELGEHAYHEHEMDGPTPLIAAMRCYVVSKFGDEVPDDKKSR